MFRFNGDYDDLTQVAPFLPAFESRLRGLEAAGEYRYNDSFKGSIPGIEGEDEDTAIYILQGLERKCREAEKVWALLADGFEFIRRLDEPTKFEHVVLVPNGRMRGEWAEYPGGRVIPTDSPDQVRATGKLYAILPKGKRSNGHLINGRKVLVKR